MRIFLNNKFDVYLHGWIKDKNSIICLKKEVFFFYQTMTTFKKAVVLKKYFQFWTGYAI